MRRTIIIALVLFTSFSFAQNIKVDYKSEFIAVTNAENTAKMSPAVLKQSKLLIKKLANTVEKQNMVLIADSNGFVLKIQEEMKLDVESMSSRVGRSMLNLYSYVYANDLEYSYGYDLDKEYVVKFNNSSVSWEITSESKIILGFKCFKAIPSYLNFSNSEKKGFPTAVWFAPELNKKGGPTLYFDLPGLILETESKIVKIIATNISETNASVSFPDVNIEVISRQEDYKRTKKISEAVEERMKN